MKFFGNVTKLEAVISAAEAALQPDLEKAGITTAQRDGKVIPIGEATLSEKYLALRAAHPPGTDLQERANLLQSNDLISKELEKTATDLAVAQTSVGSLTREKASLQEQLTAAQASITSLTAAQADLKNQLEAAVNQYSAAQKELTALNRAIATKALAYGVLANLQDAAGQPLAADAKEADKLAAAERIPAAEKLTAIDGAVTAALNRTGVHLKQVPSSTNTITATPQAREQLKGLKGIELAIAANKLKHEARA